MLELGNTDIIQSTFRAFVVHLLQRHRQLHVVGTPWNLKGKTDTFFNLKTRTLFSRPCGSLKWWDLQLYIDEICGRFAKVGVEPRRQMWWAIHSFMGEHELAFRLLVKGLQCNTAVTLHLISSLSGHAVARESHCELKILEHNRARRWDGTYVYILVFNGLLGWNDGPWKIPYITFLSWKQLPIQRSDLRPHRHFIATRNLTQYSCQQFPQMKHKSHSLRSHPAESSQSLAWK